MRLALEQVLRAQVDAQVVAFGEHAVELDAQRASHAALGAVAGGQVAAAHADALAGGGHHQLRRDALGVLFETLEPPAVLELHVRVAARELAQHRVEPDLGAEGGRLRAVRAGPCARAGARVALEARQQVAHQPVQNTTLRG
ncbi:MAG: hypothetical protein IPK29_06925 [Betaproteobacteria bacterium]|nr:hypothetical protein [Betaproteobacteria bacterium]